MNEFAAALNQERRAQVRQAKFTGASWLADPLVRSLVNVKDTLRCLSLWMIIVTIAPAFLLRSLLKTTTIGGHIYSRLLPATAVFPAFFSCFSKFNISTKAQVDCTVYISTECICSSTINQSLSHHWLTGNTAWYTDKKQPRVLPGGGTTSLIFRIMTHASSFKFTQSKLSAISQLPREESLGSFWTGWPKDFDVAIPLKKMFEEGLKVLTTNFQWLKGSSSSFHQFSPSKNS